MDGAVAARGAPSDHPVGGGVSAPKGASHDKRTNVEQSREHFSASHHVASYAGGVLNQVCAQFTPNPTFMVKTESVTCLRGNGF